ncbi:hypothetical protein CS063_12750 [Sporanaerobium hydrogeniformans]|uniref:Uncharacterized protein n=1 Tax=Sporanaerobium hydrogeniformans TaxID=3072179 RepID=A0AC61D9Q9_9FIRM|nr:YjiH family protein [Sporanaerobium hydrogeniformans]PHV70009.1 hypothetical protein CS063_12750 [Sporanaerobium hydrogeniformans]
MHTSHTPTKNIKNVLKFIIPSLIGVFLFICPLSINGEVTIPIAIISSSLQNFLEPVMLYIIALLATISFMGSIYVKCFKPQKLSTYPFIQTLFNVSPLWFIVRLLAFTFVMIILVNRSTDLSQVPVVGGLFAAITSMDTGGLVLYNLLPILFSIFLFAGLFLPLLLNFGLLEFVGNLLIKVMRPVFNLPGRSAIDCIASWLGDGTIGVLLTSKQYEEGFYTEREAAVIGTTFSLVSITFSLVVIDTVGLSSMFLPFYLTVTVASLLAAVIIPKLPPLSRKKDILFDGSKPALQKDSSTTSHHFKQGLNEALIKAEEQSFFQNIIIDGFKNVLDMWLAVIPVVMAVGTIALLLATFTPLFKILGLPFLPLLSLLGVPEAAAASQTLVAGFADMLLPSIMATSIKSDMTRFIIASVSVSQLIYLSEVGALLLGSKIPVKLHELFIIFIERTLITLPVITLIAHFLF